MGVSKEDEGRGTVILLVGEVAGLGDEELSGDIGQATCIKQDKHCSHMLGYFNSYFNITDLEFSSKCSGQHRRRPLPKVFLLWIPGSNYGAPWTPNVVQPLQFHTTELRGRSSKAEGGNVLHHSIRGYSFSLFGAMK